MTAFPSIACHLSLLLLLYTYEITGGHTRLKVVELLCQNSVSKLRYGT